MCHQKEWFNSWRKTLVNAMILNIFSRNWMVSYSALLKKCLMSRTCQPIVDPPKVMLKDNVWWPFVLVFVLLNQPNWITVVSCARRCTLFMLRAQVFCLKSFSRVFCAVNHYFKHPRSFWLLNPADKPLLFSLDCYIPCRHFPPSQKPIFCWTIRDHSTLYKHMDSGSMGDKTAQIELTKVEFH